MESLPAVSGEQELAWAQWWIGAALLGQAGPEPAMGPGLEVRQQTHGTFRVNQSVWEAPLQPANSPSRSPTEAAGPRNCCRTGPGRSKNPKSKIRNPTGGIRE
jgi:hypothetical protein